MRKLFNSIFFLVIAISISSANTFAAELEEIIVTATKKEESLQDVSASVTVLSDVSMNQNMGLNYNYPFNKENYILPFKNENIKNKCQG